MAAALLYPELGAVKGVEFLPKLFDLCNSVVENVDSEFPIAPI